MNIVYKKIGETPLECIDRLFDRKSNSYTYAGRLDPMAEGLLLILEGEECKKAKEYFNFEKTYQYSFIVGMSTDSYDCLGRIKDVSEVKEDLCAKVEKAIHSLVGKLSIEYPPFSSKTIEGKPLFSLAKDGDISEIDIPEREMNIKEHVLLDKKIINLYDLREKVLKDISLVNGDFRQEDIIEDWKKLNKNLPLQQFSVQISCEGGTYVRSIVNEISKKILYPTVTTSIKRIKIGDWGIEDVTIS